ncbi:hypothetical protein HN011_001137 [Eciton burchellii]|nr:hypothetical protein HN011_001137 [Eciton burchellii]
MNRVEFITPWIQQRRIEDGIRNEMRILTVAEPWAERHSITYFNNRKRERRIADVRSAYDRAHDLTPFDPSKPRCDRPKQSLIWAEIHDENKRHVVPMTANHSYGRPNRVQIDYPDPRFARSSKTKDFYSRRYFNLMADTA